MHKRPSSNARSNFVTPAVRSGAVSQRAEQSGAVSQRAVENCQPGGTSTENADRIMAEIRTLGYYPRESGTTKLLGEKRRRAEKAGEFSTEQLEELKR